MRLLYSTGQGLVGVAGIPPCDRVAAVLKATREPILPEVKIPAGGPRVAFAACAT
jgi:hypothetical protein